METLIIDSKPYKVTPKDNVFEERWERITWREYFKAKVRRGTK